MRVGRMLRRIGLTALAAMALAPLPSMLGPWIEQTLFPPTTGPYQIEELVRNPDGTVSIRFSAFRHYECRRVGSQWYVYSSGAWQAVAVVVAGLPEVRPAGKNISPVNTLPGPGLYMLHVDLDCWPLWRSSAEMGPFDLR